MNLESLNLLLTETLIKVTEKKISLREARSISDLARSLSINISNLELKKRVEVLELLLKKKK